MQTTAMVAVCRAVTVTDTGAEQVCSRVLADDLDWILAASGRGPSDDSRLPLIG